MICKSNHIIIEDKSTCYGCTACQSKCPNNAISMQSDEKGFLYPSINEEKCIDCGLCVKICPLRNEKDLFNEDNFNQQYFAVRSSSMNELQKSQSGGAFYLLSNIFIKSGGIVYGAIFDCSYGVIHDRATESEMRNKMRGSKYVQSDLQGVFLKVKEDLSHQLKVLFSGTPCQIAGLKSYLSGLDQNNLYCIDLICNGVGSPRIWKDYLNYLIDKYHGNIEAVHFRDKRFGWSKTIETFVIRKRMLRRRTFMTLYFKHLIHRDSCYKCPYANLKRIGDITIGDFWGWERIGNKYGDDKGLSLLIVNTSKGAKLKDSIIDSFESIGCDKDKCMQPMLLHPEQKNPLTDCFEKDLKNNGFKYVAQKYSDLSLRYKLKHNIYNLLKKFKCKS